MKTKILSILILFITQLSFSQVGIGTTNPSPSSALEIRSSNSGLLIPRVALSSTTDTNTIANPATSLLVYNSSSTNDVTPGFYYWEGSWKTLKGNASGSSTGWNLTGNTLTTGSEYIGTNSNHALLFKVNNNQFGKFSPNGGIIIGNAATASDDKSIAIGTSAKAPSQNATAIGYNAEAAQDATSLGFGAKASYQAVAIGLNSNTTGNTAIAIGANSKATAQDGISIGTSSEAAQESTAIGKSTKATGYRSTAFGNEALATMNNALAVGVGSKATGEQSTALGNASNASGQNATAIGYQALASQANSIIIGTSNNKTGIGTSTPDERLHVAGSIKIVDGTQGLGKVLTSDANGKATWQTPTSTKAYADIYFGGTNVQTLAHNGTVAFGTTGTSSNITVNNTNNNNNIQVSTAGRYRISYKITFYAGNDNRAFRFNLFRGTTLIPGSLSITGRVNNNDSLEEALTIASSSIVTLNANEQISVKGLSTATSNFNDDTINLVPNGCSLSVELID